VTHEDKGTPKIEPVVDPISGPSGLVLHPKVEEPRRVSRRVAALIGSVVLLLFLAFAYGGYKRSIDAQAAAQGTLKAVAPATAASNEFTQAIPPGNAAITHGQPPAHQLIPPTEKAPVDLSVACGVDPKTNQRHRFDPMTGRPCESQVAPVERVATRRTAPAQPRQQPRELSVEERHLQDKAARDPNLR